MKTKFFKLYYLYLYEKRQAFHSCFTLLKKDWSLIKQSKTGLDNSPYTLAMKYIRCNYLITAFEVNNVLAFLNVVIYQDLLDKILSKPRLEFKDLTKDTIKTDKFLNTMGTIRKECCIAGVYIWTHISTGDKYVGSSSSLARRLIGYFKGTHPDVGKFLPFLRKEGLNAFNLQVIPLTENYYDSLELSIEQYFLLQPQFNLNTLRVVNRISGSRSKAIYMYTKDLSKLIYSSYIQEDFIFKLKIHHSIINQSIKTNSVYLGKYVFTDQPIEGAEKCTINLEDVVTMLDKDRLEEGRKIIIISQKDSNEIKSFNSIKDCVNFLNTIAPSNKTTLYRYVDSGKPYQGYICKFSGEEIRKSIIVKVTHLPTGNVVMYPTIRKAALSFSPDINTTGQTIKAYIERGKLFKGIYKIEYYK